MHGVMGGDEQPDIQPAEQGDEDRRGNHAPVRQRMEKDGVDVQRQPRAADRHRQRDTGRSLTPLRRHGAERGCAHVG
jgi:hypothetical protein